MTQPLRIALAGLGTVGAGVVKLLDANRELIARRAWRPIVVTAISARDRSRDRGVDLASFAWEDDSRHLAIRDDVDVVVELIGGADGPALTLARTALAGGKALVTANKAMIAHHGHELAAAAEAAGVALKFEAAVAGGVPVIKGLREGAAANALSRVSGILNGTCNFILSKMEAAVNQGAPRDFAEILAEAQALGFAEADPGFDIDGIDAAHKLAILAALSFGHRPAFDQVRVTGIRHLLAADIAEAASLGFRVRLLGITEDGPGGLFQRVHPHLVPIDHPLAHVTGATNAVVAEGDFVGRLLFQGAGAGAGPTASAVVADLIDIARLWTRGKYGPAFAMPASELSEPSAADTSNRRGRSYLRFAVADRVGVLAEIAAAMRDAGVSIESLIQRGVTTDGEALVAIVTHEGPERCVAAALERLRGSQSLLGEPVWMHILAD